MLKQIHDDIDLIVSIITKQEKCIHPSDALEILNGKPVCTKCAKVMPENKL